MSNSNIRLLLYGDFTPEHLAASYAAAFAELGSTVLPLDQRTAGAFLGEWFRNRLVHRLTINSLAWRRMGAAEWNKHILAVIEESNPDLFFIIGGDFIMPETIRAIREKGVKVFQLFPDNPFHQHRSRPETLPQAKVTDGYFIWSYSLMERLQDFGVGQVVYLPFAWDPAVFPFQQEESGYDYDVTFVGGWDREREDLLEGIAELYELKIWGPAYWKTRTRSGSRLRACWQGRPLNGREAARTAGQSRIALNILRQQNLPDGTNMRSFELPGCGAFSLSTFSRGAVEIFPEKRAGAYFDCPESCAEQIDYFLANETQRKEISREAHAIVSQGHRYIDRARKILDTFQSLET